MANIFKSKEVYKHVTTEPHNGGQHKLIPVRGVYVANVYRAPYTIDHMLEITDIKNEYATVELYRETNVTVRCKGFFTNVSITIANAPPHIEEYTTVKHTNYLNLGVSFNAFIDNHDPYILYFTQTKYDYRLSPIIGEVEIVNVPDRATQVPIINDTEIDTGLQIISIDSTDAIIT